LLEVTNVSKHYPTPRGPLTVLSGVTFSLSPGQAAAIMGPSGSGKSSLLYLLGGLEPPSEGRISLDSRDVHAMSAAELADFRNTQIGFVFQDHCLLPQCSVLENVLVPTLIARPSGKNDTGPGEGPHGREKPDDFTTRARSLIEQVGLIDRLDHRPGELSGGEKQRVAIARALIRQPRLVLCDEPTGNLDPASADLVAWLLLNLHRKQENILIVVTHSARLASQFSIRFEMSQSRMNRLS